MTNLQTFPAQFNLSSLNGVNGFAINSIISGVYAECSMRGAGDVNGDGFADIIISMDNALNYAKQSYVVFGGRGPFPPTISLANLNGANGFTLNGDNAYVINWPSASRAGDINGDGIDDIIIGANDALDVGQSYVVFGSRSPFPATFNLDNLNGTNGFAVNGINAYDLSGTSVNAAGDINGDGIDDIIIGAPYTTGYYTGQSYVVFGSSSPFPAIVNATNLNGTNGFIINGVTEDNQTGFSVSGAGDVNGDGIADIIIGAPAFYSHKSQSYVIFGSRSPFPAIFNLAELNGANGFTINGINSYDNSGYSVSGAGDVNGDGIADIIIGAPAFYSHKSQSYVIFGRDGAFPAVVNMANLNGYWGFALDSVDKDDGIGFSVSSAGDVNGDGIADIIIGAPYALDDVGQSYVVFGSRSLFPAAFYLGSLNGANGFTINGIANGYGSESGGSVSGAGDVNGDGIADIIIGDQDYECRSYVVFGQNSSSPSPGTSASATPSPGLMPSSSSSPTPTPTPSISFGASPSATPTPSLTFGASPSPSNAGSANGQTPESSSTGAIVGGVIGGLAAVGLGIGLLWYKGVLHTQAHFAPADAPYAPMGDTLHG